MSNIKIRAVGMVIKDNKILLMHRTTNGKEFWVFPGGGKEEDETVEEAIVREVEEEATIKCKIAKLLYTHEYSDIGHKQYYYLCRYISGTPKLGKFNELQTMQEKDQTYEPRWIDIKKISNMLLYPLEIRDWLVEDLKNNFKDTPRSETLSTEKLRQDL